jgi:hypothetical protein
MRILVVLLLFGVFCAKAQDDSPIAVPLVGLHFGAHLPGGDMVNRYGTNLAVGTQFLYKTRRNFIYGFEVNYLFGQNVKEDVLSSLKTPEGYVVDNTGFPADLRITERAVTVHGVIGKVFRFGSTNANSGLMVNIGVGVLQHKIHFYDAQRNVAAIKDERAYGYDRLSAGLSFTQFLGYLFMSENRMLNFYVGIDCYQSFSKSLRELNYDTTLPDTERRLDVLTGLRIGWALPLYKKKPNDYYYN